MSGAVRFKVAHDRIMENAHERIAEIRSAVDAELENLAIKNFGAVESHEDDGMGPPSEPVKVHCWHCDEKYSSAEMRRMYRPRMQHVFTEALSDGIAKLSPLWWCRDAECDGAGFGHDIHPVRSRSKRKADAA